ncbi:hypothetical protein IH980_03265 [Patescibacteria group bacterium]|nr:hypothetical protein [Patescibacteria group bacterium]
MSSEEQEKEKLHQKNIDKKIHSPNNSEATKRQEVYWGEEKYVVLAMKKTKPPLTKNKQGEDFPQRPCIFP